MQTELWSARSKLRDHLPIWTRLRKLRTIDYCKPRQCYPIWRYRPRYVPRYSIYPTKLRLMFKRIQVIEMPACDTDSEEAEVAHSP